MREYNLEEIYTTQKTSQSLITDSYNNGLLRYVRDKENIITIDQGALRIGYIKRPGWGRHGVSVGPFSAVPGMVLSISLLNGHHNSQTDDRIPNYKRFIWGILQKVFFWCPKKYLPTLLKEKVHPDIPHYYCFPAITVNLAAGWHQSPLPASIRQFGGGYFVQATGVANGRLLAGRHCIPLQESIQNLPFYMVALVRKNGILYFISTLPDFQPNGKKPELRPLYFEHFTRFRKLYAGIHQSILGEINFRVDTRIFGLKVREINNWRFWYGSAPLADSLIGLGNLNAQEQKGGHTWEEIEGRFQRTPNGVKGILSNNITLIRGNTSWGLVHLFFRFYGGIQGLIFRAMDRNNCWILEISNQGAKLVLIEAGKKLVIHNNFKLKPLHTKVNSLQLWDSGQQFNLILNKKALFSYPCTRKELLDANALGLYSFKAKGVFSFFEAHPRSIPLPQELNIPSPWQDFLYLQDSSHWIYQLYETFQGPVSDLDGRKLNNSKKNKNNSKYCWKKCWGKGSIYLDGNGAARIKADTLHPNPGRTIYTLPWKWPDFAEIEAEILPPGDKQGQGEKCRAGLVFWQDCNNFLIINIYLDDWKIGKSVSSFLKFNGKEDIYKAVWTNVGDRIFWGRVLKLRTLFDGKQYVIYLNNEPVLYRALTDIYSYAHSLSIKRIGIAANWEFGDDTGSAFYSFRARRKK